MGCFLGVALTQSASTKDLQAGYGEFRQEALNHNPNYRAESVNTDGWEQTQQAWRNLFPGITVVLCFLHTVLGIQKHLRRRKDLFADISNRLWTLYHSEQLRQFSQRLRRLHEWAGNCDLDLPDKVRQKLLSIKAKAAQFKVSFEIPEAARTSNQVDRLMNYQDRILYSMQYFHGTQTSIKQSIRAMALLWNFHPYCQKVQALAPYSMSPFEDLNGFRYHDNWLRNLLIASSLNGRGTGSPIKHKLQ